MNVSYGGAYLELLLQGFAYVEMVQGRQTPTVQ